MFRVVLALGDDLPHAIAKRLQKQCDPLFKGSDHRLFAINPVVLAHAVTSMGSAAPAADLKHYLRNFDGYLRDAVNPEVLRFPSVGADYRRIAGEQCGVGVACLVVRELGVPWRNISQVLENSKGKMKRPDFLATWKGQDIVFEAKGTSDIGRLRSVLIAAKKQANEYENDVEGRLAIATYVPMDDSDPFPAHTVVIDPPLDRSDQLEVTKDKLNLLVALRLLRFTGLRKTAKAYIANFASNEAQVDQIALLETLEKELGTLGTMRADGTEYVGIKRLDGKGATYFAGAVAQQLRDFVLYGKSMRGNNDSLKWDADKQTLVSQFSDGTNLLVKGVQTPVSERLSKMTESGLPAIAE